MLAEFERLITIFDLNASLDDRLRGTGILPAAIARDLGTVGFVARASGQPLDCRLLAPFAPYDRIIPQMAVLNSCDVHARAWVRIMEIRDSTRLIRELLATGTRASGKSIFVLIIDNYWHFFYFSSH